jgi:fumarate hydratase class I
MDLREAVVELYRKCATELPEDVEEALSAAKKEELQGTAAEAALEVIMKNVQLAKEKSVPLCQDTGTPIFYVQYPRERNCDEIRKEIFAATESATREIPLRPNAVDTLTGEQLGNIPLISMEPWDNEYYKISLMLKGGGSENIHGIYSLPDSGLDAQRDLEGVRRCVLDTVEKAQGKACSPGIVGVGIGGTVDSVFELSKKQLFRDLRNNNEKEELANLEEELVKECNGLGIGPSGFGGKATVLGIKIGTIPRHPASYFVAVTYSCWATRRHTIEFRDGELKWLN